MRLQARCDSDVPRHHQAEGAAACLSLERHNIIMEMCIVIIIFTGISAMDELYLLPNWKNSMVTSLLAKNGAVIFQNIAYPSSGRCSVFCVSDGLYTEPASSKEAEFRIAIRAGVYR